MLEDQATRLLRRLHEDPADSPGWIELARLLRRGKREVEGMSPAVLPHLVAAWRLHPEVRDMLLLFQPTSELWLPPPNRELLGSHWRDSPRAVWADNHHYDRETGLPLVVMRRIGGSSTGYHDLYPEMELTVEAPTAAPRVQQLPCFYLGRAKGTRLRRTSSGSGPARFRIVLPEGTTLPSWLESRSVHRLSPGDCLDPEPGPPSLRPPRKIGRDRRLGRMIPRIDLRTREKKEEPGWLERLASAFGLGEPE